MMDLDLAQLDALAACVSEGTFDAAARALHVTPSAVSQRVKALETSVGRVLLSRSKPVVPTSSGEALLRLARQIHTLTADAVSELSDDASGASHVIPLAVNADSLATWFLPAVAAIGPPLIFDLHRADQEQTAELLRQGTVMAAVTSAAQAVPGCSVRRLGTMRYRPRAAPAFADRWFAGGATADALAHAPVVVFDRQDRLQDRYLQRRSRRQLRPPRHFVPSSADYVEAVRLGLGWGMLPDLQVERMGPDDDLRCFDEKGAVEIKLYWQQWRLDSKDLKRVAAAVVDATAGLR